MFKYILMTSIFNLYDYCPKTDLCQSRSETAEQLSLQNNFGLKPLSRAREANHFISTYRKIKVF
jgi:hypothetical protein